MQQYQFGKMRLPPRAHKKIVAVERKRMCLHGWFFPTWVAKYFAFGLGSIARSMIKTVLVFSTETLMFFVLIRT
jgi:hypothetical protein